MVATGRHQQQQVTSFSTDIGKAVELSLQSKKEDDELDRRTAEEELMNMVTKQSLQDSGPTAATTTSNAQVDCGEGTSVHGDVGGEVDVEDARVGVEELQWSMVLSRRRPVTADVPINKSNLLLISMAAPVGSMVAGGVKTVETRKYALGQQFMGKPIYIWEKPDGCRQRQARVIGVVWFSECFQYKNREAWAKDYPRHQVSKGSEFSWDGNRKMFGWVVANAQILASPFMLPSTVDIQKLHKCIFVAHNFRQTSLLETIADGNTAKDGDPRAHKGVQENVEAPAVSDAQVDPPGEGHSLQGDVGGEVLGQELAEAHRTAANVARGQHDAALRAADKAATAALALEQEKIRTAAKVEASQVEAKNMEEANQAKAAEDATVRAAEVQVSKDERLAVEHKLLAEQVDNAMNKAKAQEQSLKDSEAAGAKKLQMEEGLHFVVLSSPSLPSSVRERVNNFLFVYSTVFVTLPLGHFVL